MSSEIRAIDNTIYWIINNGNNYADGATSPNQVTTVGKGWTLFYIGNDHTEYVTKCAEVGIEPRIPDENELIDLMANNTPVVE